MVIVWYSQNPEKDMSAKSRDLMFSLGFLFRKNYLLSELLLSRSGESIYLTLSPPFI